MAESAIEYALQLQRAAAQQGFDWDEPAALWAKLAEELDELREAASPVHRLEELGDVLFMVVNIARHMGLKPEQALAAANVKFERRYAQVMQSPQTLPPLGDPRRIVEMERRWQQAKVDERKVHK